MIRIFSLHVQEQSIHKNIWPKSARWRIDSEGLFDLLRSGGVVSVHAIKNVTVPLDM